MDKPERKPESAEAGELRRHVLEEFEKPVTPEQAERLDRELAATASFFEDGDIDFYVAGGSGLDLLDGEWERDHQDLDVAIPAKDRGRFYDLAERGGFFIRDHEGKPLAKKDIEDSKTHNCFLFRERDGAQDRFETMFLPEEGAEAYDDAPTIEKDGHEIRLQPPEIILFHKLKDGRRKDFRDIRRVWDGFDDDRRAAAQRLIDGAGLRFRTDAGEETSIEVLLASAPAIRKEKDEIFFESGAAERMKKEIEGEFQRTMTDIYAVRKDAASREEFLDRLAEKYEGFIPERRAIMEQFTDFLFQDPTPDEESFSSLARMLVGGGMDERLKKKADFEFKEEKLWQAV